MQKILTKTGLIIYDKDRSCTIRLNTKETDKLLNQAICYDKLDYHCEVVHIEISDQCNMKCSYCYNEKEKKELSTHDWKFIIKSLVEYGVFQITFGGGEPLMRDDWYQLAQHAVDSGLNIGMTTNGVLLPIIKRNEIKLFKQINVSYHGDMKILEEALIFLSIHKIKSGINFIMRKEYLSALPIVAKLAKQCESELLLLTYKPLINDRDQVIDPKIVFNYAEYYKKEINIAVDGLTCYGTTQDYCLQRKTFCDIDSLGNVYPCSFIRKSIGSLLVNDFKSIWKKRGEQERCPFLN